MPETSYARCGELSLAYQVFGDGDIPLVVAGSFVSHVELFWTLPEMRAYFERIGAFCRVLVYDKAGVGLSDPVPKVRSLSDRASELEAVMDAAGFARATVMGISEGGPAAMVFAASRPERVDRLILTGTFAWAPIESWEDAESDPVEIQHRWREFAGEELTPSAEQVEQFQRFMRNIRDNWGSGEALRTLVPSVRSVRQLGMLERMSASPGMARATLEAAFRVDVTHVLSSIEIPTLVIHATGDPVPVQCGRYLAREIRGARLVETEGVDHAPWFADPIAHTRAIEDFLTGTHATTPRGHRVLRTVLFTDVVGSTELAAELGDERWRAVLESLGEITEDLVARYAGTLIKGTGDGHLATFDSPTQAIRCAEALGEDVEALGLALKAAVHAGECELIGEDIGGIAVNIAARLIGHAGSGEIIVSSAVRDLVVGSGTGFEDRGHHELRGVPGTWHLLAVDPHGARPGSREAALAALPTPPASTGMRRSDRVVALLAKRTPWVLRSLARVSPGASSGAGRETVPSLAKDGRRVGPS